MAGRERKETMNGSGAEHRKRLRLSFGMLQFAHVAYHDGKLFSSADIP